MMDLFAVFPVGSDVESETTKTGYFDASALAAAQKQKPVDTDRPFLMYRDVNQYKDGPVLPRWLLPRRSLLPSV